MTPRQALTRCLPHLIWIAGMGVFAVGVFVGPGIPYQDPTPEMQLREAQQTHLAEWFFDVGLALFAVGVTLAMVAWLVRRLLRRSPASIRIIS